MAFEILIFFFFIHFIKLGLSIAQQYRRLRRPFFFFFLCRYSYSVVAERINAVLMWFGTSTTSGMTVSKRKQCS